MAKFSLARADEEGKDRMSVMILGGETLSRMIPILHIIEMEFDRHLNPIRRTTLSQGMRVPAGNASIDFRKWYRTSNMADEHGAQNGVIDDNGWVTGHSKKNWKQFDSENEDPRVTCVLKHSKS